MRSERTRIFITLTVSALFACPAAASAAAVYLGSGSSWTVPSDWNSSNNSIEVIGAGGGAGGTGANGGTGSGGGGGGGAYSKITNLTLTPGAVVTYSIGAGGAGGAGTQASPGTASPGSTGGDTFFNGGSCGASSVCAKGGSGGVGGTNDGVTGIAGAGGAGGNAAGGIGTVRFSGGAGGAGGPYNGCGANGSNAQQGGGGGGGAAGKNGGGFAGASGGSPAGGAGGAGDSGFGGAGGPSVGANTNASSGGSGLEYVSSLGSGGGGGGGGGRQDCADPSTAAGWGGNGGLYGGGGGAYGRTVGSGNGGAGAQGLIVITYTPAPAPTCSISVSPSTTNPGDPATLSWSSTNASTMYISSVGYVSGSGSITVSPSFTTVFNGTATGASSNGTCSATITVSPLPDMIASSFTTSGALVAGNTVALSGTILNQGAAMSVSNSYDVKKDGTYVSSDTDRWDFSVAASGNYAYVGSTDLGDVFEIYNVSNPWAVTKVSGINFGNNTSSYSTGYNGVDVYGNYVYFGRTNSGGTGSTVSVVNVSNKSVPTIATTIAAGSSNMYPIVRVSGNYLYLGILTGLDSALQIYSLANPAAPVKVGQAAIVTGNSQNVRDIQVSPDGRYAYVGLDYDNSNEGTSNRNDFRIFDVSNKAAPFQAAVFPMFPTLGDTGPYGNFGTKSIALYGSYAFVETDSALVVLDISNPLSPVEVKRISHTSTYSAIGIAGKYLYVPDQVYDISTPSNPTQIFGAIGTGGSPSGVAFAGGRAIIVRQDNPAHVDSFQPHVYARFCLDNPNCITTGAGLIGGKDFDAGNLGSGASYATSTNWTATVGAHTLYFCTDAKRTVTEADETNNCTSLPITVAAAPTCSISLSPTSIQRGQSSAMTYSSTNATGGTISPLPGSVGPSGTYSAAPQNTTSYSGVFSSAAGTTANCSATLTVTCAPIYSCAGNTIQYTNASCTTTDVATCASPTICVSGQSSCVAPDPVFVPTKITTGTVSGHIQAKPALVRKGGSAGIYWNVSNVSSCTVSGNGDTWSTASSSLASCTHNASGGCLSSPINGPVWYTLACTGIGGGTAVNESAQVVAAPVYQEL